LAEGFSERITVWVDKQALAQRPEREVVLFVNHRLVVHEQCRPLTVSLQLRERALHEEPFETSQCARERFAVDQLKCLVREGCRFVNRYGARAIDQNMELLHVTRDTVRGVQT